MSLTREIHLFCEKYFLLRLGKCPGSFKNSHDSWEGRISSITCYCVSINNQWLLYQNCPKCLAIQKRNKTPHLSPRSEEHCVSCVSKYWEDRALKRVHFNSTWAREGVRPFRGSLLREGASGLHFKCLVAIKVEAAWNVVRASTLDRGMSMCNNSKMRDRVEEIEVI